MRRAVAGGPDPVSGGGPVGNRVGWPRVRAGSRGPIWRRPGGAAVSALRGDRRALGGAGCGPGATSQSSNRVRKNIKTMRFGNARRAAVAADPAARREVTAPHTLPEAQAALRARASYMHMHVSQDSLSLFSTLRWIGAGACAADSGRGTATGAGSRGAPAA